MTASHVKIGFFALCLAAVIGVPSAWLSYEGAAARGTDIAIEHVAPLTLHVRRLASSGTNVFDIRHTASGSIALHLPASWIRKEVRGVPIAAVTGEATDAGYVRWVLPKGAAARFDAPDPGRITLHNPSGIPLTVSTTTVSHSTGEREDEATVVTDGPYVLP